MSPAVVSTGGRSTAVIRRALVMARRISGVLIDIGGVLVALDGVPSMAKLLAVAPEHDVLHGMWTASPAVVAHETGKIGPLEFAAGIVEDFKLPVSPEQFLEDFFGWLKGPLPGAVDLLNEHTNCMNQ